MQQQIDIHLPRPHAAQRQIIREAKRYNCVDLGRRSGKDILGADRLIQPALEGKPVAWFAPTYKMLSENWKSIVNITQPITRHKSEQEKQLTLITGGVIDMWSLDQPDAARGRKYARVVINEAAMIAGLIDAWSMVIRPTLADLKGDAWFLSTPKGLNGFYTLWQRGKTDPDWASWQMPTSCNPFIDASEIDAMRAELPDRVFRQEILAEFLEDGAYFQGVDAAATVAEPAQVADHAGHTFIAACDWGLSGDFTVIAIGCRECCSVVDWDRFTNMEFSYQREKLYAICDKWQVTSILPERNSFGEPNIELIRDRVAVADGPDGKPGFNTSATTKPPLIQGLAGALEHGGFRVPSVAADELRMYQVETMTSGHPKFSAPSGAHDDFVMALALLWHAMGAIPWLMT